MRCCSNVHTVSAFHDGRKVWGGWLHLTPVPVTWEGSSAGGMFTAQDSSIGPE